MADSPRKIEAKAFKVKTKTTYSWEVDTAFKGKMLVVGAKLDVVEGGAITFTSAGDSAPFLTFAPAAYRTVLRLPE